MNGEKHRPILLGAHFSIAKGFHKAILEATSYKCNALQIFTKNANSWKEKTLNETEITQFKKTKTQAKISHILSHTSYLINIAGPDKKKADMSCSALKQEFIRCSQLDIPHVVLHPGSHMGQGEDKGIRRITDHINNIFDETEGITTRLLLETTAGQGTSIGHTFEQLKAIINGVLDKTRIGVCLDTCHIFAAGYNIFDKNGYEKTIRHFDDIIGLENLFAIHLNDTQKTCGSRVDRHEHIGDGFIGLDAFRYLINDPRLNNIPKIIETPKEKNGQDADTINLELLRKLQFS